MSHPSALYASDEVAPLLARAAASLRAGFPAAAIEPLQQAALLQPANAILQHDLGLALLESGRTPDAIAAFRRAVALQPQDADSWFRLGIALEKLGDAGAAIVAYDRATELHPSLSEAWFRAGALVFMLGHRAEAIGCFQLAADTGGKSPFARLGKARALLTENRNAEAEQVLRQAIDADPANAMAHELLGTLLTEYGRFGEARKCFARAIGIAPVLAGDYYELVRCRTITPADDSLLQRMHDALDTPGLESGQRLRVHLALGKAADDLGDYASAMRHFDTADDVRRQASSFDAAAFSTEVDRLIARCTPELIAQASAFGSPDPTPVLIIGMPRSGTTLVEQIVSNHPEAAGCGELNFWNTRGLPWLHASSAHLDAGFLASCAADYLAVLRTYTPRAARITDKMPFNFLWAGLIHLAFPRATFLHCRRAPIDTALSIHQTHFHPGMPFPTGGTELVDYYRAYQRLTDHWRRILPPDRFLDVSYEELTLDPEPPIRRILAACGLPWHPACLRPESNPRAVNTPSKWQARQPIYRSSVARWKRYEPYLGPLRTLLED